MGNEHSSSRYHDDDETFASGLTGGTGYTEDRPRSSRKSGRKEIPTISHFIDSICGRMVFDDDDDASAVRSKYRRKGDRPRSRSTFDSFDDDATFDTEMEERERSRRKKKERSKYDSIEEEDESSFGPMSPTSLPSSGTKSTESAEEESAMLSDNNISSPLSRPLASAFAKRCFFTKAGIGPLTQHYEGITSTGNSVLMLGSAMKLKGCPTICDEDLRRVEESYPNQFSRLPDELLLSSGWRRISKYCHFSGKPIPDGIPFYHSKDRVHPQTGGYYFLLASSLGMDDLSAEPISIDMLILMQADYPQQCDQAPKQLLEDPEQWHLVTKFCHFSGGPINSIEDVYYEADFDGRTIYMLAFLSPNLTPEELYRLNDITGESALKTVSAVEEVDEVYNLNDRDFEDLKLYHLGPCRSLPSELLRPDAWRKVLPQSFIDCREKAFARAYEFEAHAQMAVAAAGKLIGNGDMVKERSNSRYTEFNDRPTATEVPLSVTPHIMDNMPSSSNGASNKSQVQTSPHLTSIETPTKVGNGGLHQHYGKSYHEADQHENIGHDPFMDDGDYPVDDEQRDPVINVGILPTPSDEHQPMDEKLVDSSRHLSPSRSTVPGELLVTPLRDSKFNIDTSSKDNEEEPSSVQIASFNMNSSNDPPNMNNSKDSYSRSAVMKGAHELLKKNREERLKLMEKRKSSRTSIESESINTATLVDKKSPIRTITPVKQSTPSKLEGAKRPASPKISTTVKEDKVKSESAVNAEDDVSDTSSAWTDTVDPAADQRRALILKMAKSRMKSKKSLTESSNSES